MGRHDGPRTFAVQAPPLGFSRAGCRTHHCAGQIRQQPVAAGQSKRLARSRQLEGALNAQLPPLRAVPRGVRP
jgi:hypothetical protein